MMMMMRGKESSQKHRTQKQRDPLWKRDKTHREQSETERREIKYVCFYPLFNTFFKPMIVTVSFFVKQSHIPTRS